MYVVNTVGERGDSLHTYPCSQLAPLSPTLKKFNMTSNIYIFVFWLKNRIYPKEKDL
jgi:hypothetical protein